MKTDVCTTNNVRMIRHWASCAGNGIRRMFRPKLVILLIAVGVCLYLTVEGYYYVSPMHQDSALYTRNRYTEYNGARNHRRRTIFQSTKEESNSSESISPDSKREMSSLYGRQKIFEEAFLEEVSGPSPAILLLTYMRSGSSVTGDIIQRHEDVFYVFEPIFAIEKAELENDNILFLNGTQRYPGRYNKTELYMTDLTGWLTCDFTKITVQSLYSFMMKFGRKTQPTYRCLKQSSDFSNKLNCLRDLKSKCLSSKTKVVKTIRSTMKMAKGILETISGSKVIHLIRDPRPTVKSRRRIDRFCSDNFTGKTRCSKFHCDSVIENTREFNALDPDLRLRVVTIKYENILKDPVGQGELLYKFIGMNYTDDIRQYAYDVTLGGDISNCTVCKMKWQAGKYPDHKLSTHVQAWKAELTVQNVIDIQHDCHSVLSYYGYKLYDLDD